MTTNFIPYQSIMTSMQSNKIPLLLKYQLKKLGTGEIEGLIVDVGR